MATIDTFKVVIGDQTIAVRAPKLDIDTNLRELSNYLGKPFEDLKRRFEEASKKYGGFAKFIKVTEEEWNSKKIDEDNPEEIMNFYAQTENYIPELMITAATEDKQRLTRFVVAHCLKEGVKKILDFGCGIGEDSIVAALNELDTTAVDIEGKTFDFAKWRFRKYSINVKTIGIKYYRPLDVKYDAITCFEVLQHVPDPEKTLEHFYERLNKNGILFITTRFKNNYALALKKNEKYDETLDDIVKSKGFKLSDKIHRWGPEDSSGKWLYIYKKQ